MFLLPAYFISSKTVFKASAGEREIAMREDLRKVPALLKQIRK